MQPRPDACLERSMELNGERPQSGQKRDRKGTEGEGAASALKLYREPESTQSGGQNKSNLGGGNSENVYPHISERIT